MTTIIRNIILLFFATTCLTSCLFDSSSDRVIGKYEVLWIDLPENQMLDKETELHSSGSTTLIEPYVFAVGHNAHYIITKQHPTSGFKGGYRIHADTTNYYIIDIDKEKDKIFGPLTLKQFDNLRSELNIENIKFDQTYPDSY